MTRRGLALVRRLAVFAALAALALNLSGDRTSAAGVPAPINGQDPLEVLELKVRPNVIVVLDSSGSMTLTSYSGGGDTQSGEHPASKLAQAKRVITQVVTDNQNKVSFMFGQYSQDNSRLSNTGAGYNRFQYTTTAPEAATLTALRARWDDAASNRGLQSWQIINSGWNTLYFSESNGAQCTATITGTPKFYARGGSGTSPATSTTPQNLAYDLQTAMNSAACTGGSRANTYKVSYSAATGVFTFAATGPNGYALSASATPNNISGALGGLPATVGTPGSGTPTTITLSGVTRLRRLPAEGRVYLPADPGVMVGDTCTVTGASNGFNGTFNVTLVWSSANGYFRMSGPTGTDRSANTIGTISCTLLGAAAGTPVNATPYTLLYRNTGTGTSNALASPFRDGMDTRWTLTEEVSGTTTNYYQVATSRLWNGETIQVSSAGEVCGMSSGAPTDPPSLTLEPYDATCGASAGAGVLFTFAGGRHGASNTCRGYNHKVDLIPCDLQSPPAPLQITPMMPTLQPISLFNPDGTMVEYSEAQDGTWRATAWPVATTGGARASGSTPLGNTLMDLKVRFNDLWSTGLSTGPWAAIPAAQRAIMNHRDPKEKTIVLFVTDGNDTCDTRTSALGETDYNALRAARKAELLYERIDAAEPASSVQTYVIGYGGAFSGGEPTRLNWIAWGGSGLTNVPLEDTGTEAERWSPTGCAITTSAPNNTTCVSDYLDPLRARCPTCTDAFVAPDADKLAEQLQSIIDQGASEGEFNAQQSITESVFEYVHRTPGFDAAMPSQRYKAIVPTLFASSFSLPGFRGQLKAYQNDGSGNTVQMWSAGDKLLKLVKWGDSNFVEPAPPTPPAPPGGTYPCEVSAVGGCTFDDLQTAIKRRIYTTDRNGLYFTHPYDPAILMSGGTTDQPDGRQSLWPPTAPGLLQNNYTSVGAYDAALGLPPDAPTSFPPSPVDKFCDPDDLRASANPKKAYDECWFNWLGKKLQACVGTATLPTECTTGTYADRLKAARREAREISLAFMAGATTIPDTTGILRTPSTGAVKNAILYKARSWVLADSELATAAVMTPPSLSEPEATPYIAEYKLYRDGTRDANGKNVDSAGAQIPQGFGLTQPDDDQSVGQGAADTRVPVKPVMSVVYAPANDMLHAFRAGPCDTPGLDSPGCTDTGGEELWGFVPYDQLHTLLLRAAHEPQGKANHVYSIARGLRFADVFVPGAMTNVSIGGVTVPSMQGVWRRILYFGRGIGGKHVTALDVTAPGPYTASAQSTTPPIPLWSRGNPDTQDGLPGGAANGSSSDAAWYQKMGETWSMPTVAYVNQDKTNALYVTPRRRDGVDFVLFMGSGYGNPNTYQDPQLREGTTHYTLDALSGDVVAAADLEDAAANNGLTRSNLAYNNAIVANSVSFNRSSFTSISAKVFNVNPHPWAFVSARVYVGDLHGRLWKFLTEFPGTAIPAADLGADQPVGTAVALMGQDIDPLAPNPDTMIPNIFVTTGNDRRAAGPFRNFSILDAGASDTDIATTGTQVYASPIDGASFTTFLPVRPQFTRTFDPGTPEADCGYPTEAVFRGTIQPTSAVECDGQLTGSKCDGALLQRVFFGGTRLSVPNTKFAPPTPLSCSTGEYPCRSQFDSILYALGVKSGLAAYDLNTATDDAYRIFRDSRIAAIFFQADPDPGRGGSRFGVDEGLVKGVPKPPPPPGIPPTTTSATASVVLRREPGQPAPVVQYGSTVCQ